MVQNNLVFFQIALGVWQTLKFTPLAALIEGLTVRFLSLVLPGVFPAYKKLQKCPGCLFKTVKCVVLIKSKSQSKTKRLTNPKKQVTMNYHRSAQEPSATEMTVFNSTERTESMMPRSGPGGTETVASKPEIPEADFRDLGETSKPEIPEADFRDLGETSKVEEGRKKMTWLNSTEHTEPTMPRSGPGGRETVASKPEADFRYLGETFKVEREGNKVYVREWSYYNISGGQWEKICDMEKKCFKTEKAGKGSEKENEVVFVKGCKYIWQKVATGKVMEFEEVLDDIIFENNDTVLISNDVWFLPVDLSEKSEGKLPKLLNWVGIIPQVNKHPFWPTSLTIAAAVLEFWESLRSCIYRIINTLFCWLVQYICNKLPYPVRRFVYWLFIWVQNLKPRNDIELKVLRRDCLNVVIGGSAKTNSAQETTQVDWLDQEEKGVYEFRCGCSIVMRATYDEATEKCTATMQHSNAVFGSTEKSVFLKCEYPEEFMRIGTFLSCLATSKVGSLFKYDRNDNIVHVRKWRESLRGYVDAGFPKIYKLTLHDVIV